MPTYRYVARARDGQAELGRIDAANRVEAILQIKNRGWVPVSLDEPRTNHWGRKSVSKRSLANCYSGLGDLIESGMPLLRAIEIVASQLEPGRLKAALSDVKSAVADGKTLASAMALHPGVFDEVSRSMISVGEEAGFLETSLQRVAQLVERQEEIRGKLVNALVYPTFLMVAGILVTTGMMLFFVPLFDPLFERMRERGELPWATEALLQTSGWMRVAWGIPCTIILVATLVFTNWRRSDRGAMVWDRARLRMPALGPIVRDFTLARVFHLLGMLLANGVPVLQSLRMAQKAANNHAIQSAVEQSCESVAQGGTISVPLTESGLFPRDVTELIAVGEHSNRLENILATLAERLERRAQKQLDVVTKMLEPVLMTLLAAMIGFLIIALLLPVFTSSGKFA